MWILRVIADKQNVSTMRYNGVGWMKSFTEGANTYWNTHDHQGRTLMTRRGSDVDGSSDPAFKQSYVYHNAGRAGSGSSSFRNGIVLRDFDRNNDWDAASDGVLEARHYYAQNHRGDIVATVTDAGELVDQIRYDAYGYPTALPSGDTNSDGAFDAKDVITGTYDIRKDVNLDGSNNINDLLDAFNIHGNYITLGRGVLSHSKNHNRIGWQGSEHNSATPARLVHTPARAHHVVLGRWLSRDPSGSVDGPNLYQYARSSSIGSLDWSGYATIGGGGGCTVGDNTSAGAGCGGSGPNTQCPPGYIYDPITQTCTPPNEPNPDPPCVSCGTNPGYGIQRGSPSNACDQCCTDACNDAPSFHGITVCCGKTITSCVCLLNIQNPVPGSGLGKPNVCYLGLLISCTKKHENKHRSDFNCSSNPDCELGLYPHETNCDAYRSEIEAWMISIECLKSAKTSCASLCASNQKACRDAIDDRIRIAKRRRDYFQDQLEFYCTGLKE